MLTTLPQQYCLDFSHDPPARPQAAVRPFALAEQADHYRALRPVSGEELIAQSLVILEERFRRGPTLTGAAVSRRYFIARLARYPREVFACAFLDNQHRLITCEELFLGTIDSCSVHPRAVAQQALRHNAAAVIFAHNHPSGLPKPSMADEQITQTLKTALAYLDIRVLDHIVVGATATYSFAEHGLL